ncbi:MAG: U32 family peptidase [Eggerthellaceae bacterium]|nr:U32 family peptidase [Eggerthellaceae bacterium]
MELLAPAGGWEQLRAAVLFGADAVYLATDRFGMRARAANFALDDLPAAVALAHEAGVRVHVACNVLMMPGDIDELPAYLRAVQAAGADALIVGDVGAAALAREHAPDVALHVSTQASVANAAAARVWRGLGASRVVCAREMTLDDIARLRQDAPPDLEIEAFAHGAQCMAVSGRCLISSYLTGRSGNQGHCTQPCRWSYALEEEKRPGEHFPVEEDGRGTFIMNAKDLNMLAHLDALAAAGVDAIKLEGRNKKAFYVATVTGAYRRVLDGEPAADVASELLDVSHRPYSTGFYFGEAEQACDYDGYEQQALHVADVLACDELAGEGSPAADAGDAMMRPRYRLTVRCRTRFAERDALEALVPGAPARALTVRDLTWLPDPTDDDPRPAPEPVAVANRSCNRYTLVAEAPASPGSFLRARTFRRSARHG